jgi:hypothetical protein
MKEKTTDGSLGLTFVVRESGQRKGMRIRREESTAGKVTRGPLSRLARPGCLVTGEAASGTEGQNWKVAHSAEASHLKMLGRGKLAQSDRLKTKVMPFCLMGQPVLTN